MKKVISVKQQNGKVYIIYAYYNKDYAPDSTKEYFYIFHKIMKATKDGNPDYRYNTLEYGTCRESMEFIFPELKDLFAIHLRTEDGIPIFEIDNSACYLVTKNASELARQLWITEEEAEKIIDNYVIHDEEYKFKEAKKFIRKFIKQKHFHKVWKKKMEEVIYKYNLK